MVLMSTMVFVSSIVFQSSSTFFGTLVPANMCPIYKCEATHWKAPCYWTEKWTGVSGFKWEKSK